MSDSLQRNGPQHARLPCPSLSPGACSNSCSLSQWCHPTISCSVIPFSSCPQSFPASGCFPMSQLFPSGGQSIGAPALASVLPITIQDWFAFRLTGLISLLSKGLASVFSNTIVQKPQCFSVQPTLVFFFPYRPLQIIEQRSLCSIIGPYCFICFIYRSMYIFMETCISFFYLGHWPKITYTFLHSFIHSLGTQWSLHESWSSWL